MECRPSDIKIYSPMGQNFKGNKNLVSQTGKHAKKDLNFPKIPSEEGGRREGEEGMDDEECEEEVESGVGSTGARPRRLSELRCHTQQNHSHSPYSSFFIFSPTNCDEAHFWLNGYVNKQNCRIWSEANQQVYVETPLHPEKLTVWCALWAGGIIGPYYFKNDEGHNVTVNGDRYRAMITNFSFLN
ncbi:hypothetical protein TNCV_200701 [Trichonephila clavipes]|nr:hypothetical protein TNCV_200701 [Trichonephila clavipes]